MAGAAAHLVFLISDFGDLDIPTVISASDSTAAWWRTQVLAWGLNAEASQHYRAWAGEDPTDGGWTDLRAASLIAGHTADHGSWRSATSLAARHRLLRSTPTTDPAVVSNALDALRLAGDDDHLQRGTTKTVLDGPASAAATLTDQIDLTRSTRTSSKADLTLLTRAGDVTPTPTADRHIRALLDLIADPAGTKARLSPPYLIHPAVLNALSALLRAASNATRAAVTERILELAPEQDQLAARSWAHVVGTLPRSCWTEHTTTQAVARAGDHESGSEYALLAVAAPHQPLVKARLLREATKGNSTAIDALGRVADIPATDAAQLLGIVLDQIRREQGDAQTIGYGFGGVEWTWWLTALNLNFPDLADWTALLDEINSPTAHPGHLTSALLLLGAHTADIPKEQLPAVSRAVDELSQRPRHPWGRAGLDSALDWARLTLHDADGSKKDPVPALLMGASNERENAALLLGRRDAAPIVVLNALAFDSNVAVRAAAAHAIGVQLGRHPDQIDLHPTVARLLTDPGTRVARNIVQGLPEDHEVDVLAPHQEVLRWHLSAVVRQAAEPPTNAV